MMYQHQALAAGSRHGSPMHSPNVGWGSPFVEDSGYSSPAGSCAAGPSPFTTCGSAGGTPRAAAIGVAGGGDNGGGLMSRARTLTRRQSRLAPKPPAAGEVVRLAVWTMADVFSVHTPHSVKYKDK
jgi:hypothetical protein